jgi:NAD(P)-dependent dehydrogenase (short-subunit alcohol dehydrogenase family)
MGTSASAGSDQRVAIVTGAGRGLGRAHAHALATQGVRVVINDLSPEHADEVVAELQAVGASAVASYDSVSTPDNAKAIVGTALDSFGRVDIVVNNAGTMANGWFEEMTPAMLDAMLDVHVRGSFFVTQSAWPSLRESPAGRVVMTSSAAGMFAMQGDSNYATAKAGVYGLCKALACEGEYHGIKVNAVLPMANTMMSTDSPVPDHAAKYPKGLRQALSDRREAAAVSPLVAYLASPECAVNGEAYSAGFGRYARVFVGETVGWVADDGLQVTPADIAERLDRIRELDGFAVPADIYGEIRHIAAVLGVTVESGSAPVQT